jgi:hypothetical protein
MMGALVPEPHRRASLAIRIPLFGVIILLVLFVLIGCRTGDSGGDGATSVEEFSAEISSTCEPHTARLWALTRRQEKRGEPSMRRYGEVFRSQARITERLISDLEQLQPPESVVGAWDRFLDSLEGANTYAAELGAEIGAAFSGGKPDMEALMEVGQRDKEKEEAMNEAEMGYGEAVRDLNRAGVMSECFSGAISEFEVGQKEPNPPPPGQQPAEPYPQGPK